MNSGKKLVKRKKDNIDEKSNEGKICETLPTQQWGYIMPPSVILCSRAKSVKIHDYLCTVVCSNAPCRICNRFLPFMSS